MQPIIEVQNLSKQYRLGTVGTGTIKDDINRWWHRVRGKEDPYLQVGDVNDRTQVGESDYVWALRGISFSVQPGEVLGIIGRNGAGKSTLLKILSRITTPTTGSVRLRGRVASLLEVGTGMHGELTGRENIYLNGAILGMRRKEIDRKLDEIIDFSGVERYVDTPVKRYSSGMHVRLGFAVAAHLEPDILIVDEVLAVGDLEFQKKCIGKMKQVSTNEGRTIFFVSHNMDAIQKLCPKSMVMSNGLISFIGKTSDTISHYIKEYQDLGKLKKSENIVGQSGILLKSFELKNIEGEAISNISFGQDWLLELKVEFPRAIQKGRIALGILSETEIPLRTIFCEPQDFLKKAYTFSINLGDIWLSPGTYLINLGFSENEVPIDFFGIMGYFQVIELNTQIGNDKLFRISSTAFILNTCKIDITYS